MKQKIKVGIAQIAPVWLNQKETIKKVIQYIGKAKKSKCSLVTFGEALVPGYPFWVELTNGAKFESEIQKDIYAHYVDQAISVEGGDLAKVCAAARKNKVAVVLGTIEKASNRGGHSCYCSLVYIDATGEIKNVHRKTMPTYEERLVWATGDGHGLRTFPHEAFTLGALNCWENWMPLSRAALYGQGENLHVALWPGSVRNTIDLTRYIAKESRSYVISVCGIMKSSEIPDDIPHAKLIRKNAPKIMANGGSCIAGPDGKFIISPLKNKEKLLVAEIDHTAILRERQNFDVAGHYSRPDVTKLVVNRERQSIVNFKD